MEQSNINRKSIFISYAREDKDFVVALKAKLEEKEVECLGDWDLTAAINFQSKLKEYNLAAMMFLFIISPDSIRSNECKKEIALAVENKKVILPLSYRDHGDDNLLDSAIRVPQWIFIKQVEDIDSGLPEIIRALKTDFQLMEVHSSLLLDADEWISKNKNSGYLLKKNKLKEAEKWLQQTAVQPDKLPQPTPLQIEYIVESQKAKTKSTRVSFGIAVGVAFFFLLIALYAVQQKGVANNERDNAIKETKRAKSNALNSETLLANGTGFHSNAIVISKLAFDYDTSNLSAWKTFNNLIYDDNLFVFKSTLISKPSPLSYHQHTQALTTALLSNDKSSLVTASYDKTAKIYNLKTGKSMEVQLPYSQQMYTLMGIRFPAYYGFLPKGWEDSEEGNITYDQNLNMQVNASKDGNYLLFTNGNNYAEVRDWNGTLITTLNGHKDRILFATFNNESTQIATASNDNTINLYDLKGKLINTLSRHTGNVISCEFSKKDDYILSVGTDKLAIIWNCKGFAKAVLKHPSKITAAKFWNKHSLIITTCWDKKIRIWDLAGNLIYEIFDSTFSWTIDISPDEERFVTSAQDGKVKLWGKKGNLLYTFENSNPVGIAKFYPQNNDIIFTGDANGVTSIWTLYQKEPGFISNDTALQALSTPLTKHTGAIQDIQFSLDGKQFYTAGQDGVAKMWNLFSNDMISFENIVVPQLFTHTYSPFSPDNSLLVLPQTDSTVKIFDIQQKKITHSLNRFPALVSRSFFSPKGDYLLTDIQNGTMQLFETSNYLLKRSLPMAGYFLPFFNESREVYTCETQNTVQAFNINGSKRIVIDTFEKAKYIVASELSQDKTSLMVAASNGSIGIFDTSGKLIHHFVVDTAYDFEKALLSPNKKYLAASTKSTLYVWDTEKDTLLIKQEFENRVLTDYTLTLTFSPDSKNLLYTSGDSRVFLISIPAHKINIPTMKNLTNKTTNQVAFSYNGKYMLSAGSYGVYIWSLKGELLFNINPFSPSENDQIMYACFSYNNKYVYAVSSSQKAYLFAIDPNIIFTKIKQTIDDLDEAEKQRLEISK